MFGDLYATTSFEAHPSLEMLLHQQSQAVPMLDHFSTVQAMSAPKPHNACDECRSRKLKCSGEPTGCARCAQDGVTCRYSPRKQMGRPRKRRREEETGLQNSHFDPWAYTTGADDQGTGFTGQEHSMAFPDILDPQLGMNGSLSTFDMSSIPGSAPFVNGSNDSTGAGSYESPCNDFIPNNPDHGQYGISRSTDFAGWIPSPTTDQTASRPYNALHQIPTPSASEHTTTADATVAPSSPVAKTCDCITTLYQTLSTFSSAPEAFFPYGISRLKRITSTAWKALRCDICAQTYANSLQNSSALNTLMNLIVTEYSKILKEIDERSQTEDKIQFRMGETNSIETQHLHTGTTDCPMAITIDLKGSEWRTLARNAVRKEIFGERPGDECIARLVDETKQRQIRWHNKFALENGRQEYVMHLNEHGEAEGFECTGLLYMKRLAELLDSLGL